MCIRDSGTGSDIGLCHGPHLDCRLDPNWHPLLLQHICDRQGVDGRSQHTHMISADPLHLVAAVFYSAPEVSAADDHAYLDTQLHTLLHYITDTADHMKIQAAGSFASQEMCIRDRAADCAP